MINIAEYQKLLWSNYEIIQEQIKDLTDADAILQPPNGGNCLLWVMGHLADNLREIMVVLGGDIPESTPDLRRYGYGSEPIKCLQPGLLTMDELKSVYDRLHNAVINKLSEMHEEDFDLPAPFHGGTARRGWAAFFFEFHHAFHIGQLEFLRNLAGHTEKVI